MIDRFLFNSFWQAGFECSTHVLKTGVRLDLVASTGHDIYAEQDFARIRNIGMRTAREGLRWHLIEKSPGQYDFSTALPILEAAQRQGIQLIWDVVHFGWPDHLDVFDSDWVSSLGDMASAFGRLLRAETSETAFVAPVNEMSFVAWGGGDVAYLNPFTRNRGPELKRQLVRGALRASEALLAELPGVRLVAPEPAIHIVGDPNHPDDIRQSAEYTSSMFEVWDMLSGRAQPELGGREKFLDVIGINYYDRNQWWNLGKTIYRQDPQYRPFREILAEIYARYRRPLFVSETGTENEDRPHWLAYIAQEARAAMHAGVSFHGICLYPILNHPGWDDDRHCFNGLWDYPQPGGGREIYQPLAEELHRNRDLEKQIYESTNPSPKATGRFDLSLSPALELRVSTSPTLDEQIRPGTSGLLCRGADI